METERAGLPILSFADQAAWENWLAVQPRGANGLWLKLAKQSAQVPSLSKQAAIDGALCHGWIDGQLNPFDADWWLIRFTPRKSRSKWSEKNCRRAEHLLAQGQIAAGGLAEIDAARADGRWDAAYAPASTATEPEDLRSALDADPAARAFFDKLTGNNRYAILYRIQDARKRATRAARIAKFVAMCAKGETIR